MNYAKSLQAIRKKIFSYPSHQEVKAERVLLKLKGKVIRKLPLSSDYSWRYACEN